MLEGGSQSGEAADIVEKIDISFDNASVRFVGNEYMPDEYFVFGNNPGMRMFLKFEYTNKREDEAGFCKDFDIRILQNGQELDRVLSFDGEVDLTTITNYARDDVVNETIPIHIPVIMNDYSPIIVTVSTLSAEPKVTQTMEITVEAPEDVIVPNEQVAEPDEFIATWINTTNGDLFEFNKGNVDPKTGVVKGTTDCTPADWDTSWSNPYYTIDGDILTLGKERFRISKENDKLYLDGLDTDTRYMKMEDFLKFEDIEVHKMGEKVSTDKIELTLNTYGYANEVDPVSLGGNVSVFQKEMLVPDNGMIWTKIGYNLFCTSEKAIPMDVSRNNIRFTVVYKNNYLFEMDRYTNNYITKGYGSDDHVEWLGSHSEMLTIQPLASEDFDTWIPVASAIRDDSEGAHHVLVYLPASTGTQIFVYDVSESVTEEEAAADTQVIGEDSIGESYSADDIRDQIQGTWVKIDTDTTASLVFDQSNYKIMDGDSAFVEGEFIIDTDNQEIILVVETSDRGKVGAHFSYTMDGGKLAIHDKTGTFEKSESSSDAVTYSDTDTIKAVQEALNNAGYDCGAVDGNKGPHTTEVIQQYQTDNGLESTGEIDDALLSSLGLK